MTHTIEELIKGVWIPIEVFTPTDQSTSRELAEAISPLIMTLVHFSLIFIIGSN